MLHDIRGGSWKNRQDVLESVQVKLNCQNQVYETGSQLSIVVS